MLLWASVTCEAPCKNSKSWVSEHGLGLCVYRAPRPSCATNRVTFLMCSQISWTIFVPCVSLDTSPRVPTVGLLWEDGRLEAKISKDPFLFLFSSQRKGPFRLRKQRAFQKKQSRRGFLRREWKHLKKQSNWADHLVPVISNKVEMTGRMLQV